MISRSSSRATAASCACWLLALPAFLVGAVLHVSRETEIAPAAARLDFEAEALDLDTGTVYDRDAATPRGSPSGDLFADHPAADVLFVYNADRAAPAVLLHNQRSGVRIGLLPGTPFESVTAADVARLIFMPDPVDRPLGPDDTTVIETDTGAHFKLGHLALDDPTSPGSVGFDWERLDPLAPSNRGGSATPGGLAPSHEPGAPAGLAPEEWRRLRELVREASYHVDSQNGSLTASNQAQGLRATFGERGAVLVEPLDGGRRSWAWGLSAVGYGYEGESLPLDAAPPAASGNRVEYRGSNLSEWWVNEPTGLEQGFTLREPPGEAKGRPLVVRLKTSGSLRPGPGKGGSEIVLLDGSGRARLRYEGLRAWDAEARALPARMTLDERSLTIAVDDRGARYPVTIDPTIRYEDAKLLADDGAEWDNFGNAVAISGDTAVVGAWLSDDRASNCGAAYVFTRSGTSWTRQAKLTASDGAVQDEFGISVAVSGDTVVVGARLVDDRGFNAGSAYVFTRSGGVWTQQAKLLAIDGAAQDEFGYSVSVSGDTAVIAAYFDDDRGSDSGSAYIFIRSGGVWVQQAKLLASDGVAYDNFGTSVAISGDTVVVGAYRDDDLGTDSGSTHVFTRSGTVWTQQAKLRASDGAAHDHFGNSVAISADTVVVGAHRDDDWGTDSGSAYVFSRSGTAWSQQAKLRASDGAWMDYFGYSVAVSGDTVVVGARYDDAPIHNSGSAYVFTRTGAVWTQHSQLRASDGAEYDDFGFSVAVSSEGVVVGAHRDDDGAPESGSAYVFDVDCVDADGDGYCISRDCDDANGHCTADCSDADGDDWCVGLDCDDSRASCTSSCVDADGDGATACGGDCDDANRLCTTDCTDADADGWCVGFDCDEANAHCTTDCTDADGDGWCVGFDCDDSDPGHTSDHRPPTPAAGGPYALYAGASLVLDGRGSTDSDAGCGDAIVGYEWDLDGDATADVWGDRVQVQWDDLNARGLVGLGTAHPVTLTVTDSFGLAASAGTTFTFVTPPPYEMARWEFEEGTGPLAADSVSGRAAVLGQTTDPETSDPEWVYVDPVFGNVLSLTQYEGDLLTVADDRDFDFTNGSEMTLMMRVRKPGDPYTHLVGKRVWCNEGNYQLADWGEFHFSSTYGGIVGAPSRLSVGVWHHVAVTYDRTTLRLYVDGVMKNSGPNYALGPANLADLVLGGSGTCATFDGLIDDVSIWRHALGDAAIADAASRQVPRVTGVDSVADTGDGRIAEAETTSVGVTRLLVAFSEPVRDYPGHTHRHDATNPRAYLLVEGGGDGVQTIDCATGAAPGDAVVPIDAVAYDPALYRAALDVNGGSSLPTGAYRLLVCGGDAIQDEVGNRLDGNDDGVGGDDFALNFAVSQPPDAVADAVGTGQDTAVTFDVLANDGDPDGNLDPASTNTGCAGCSTPAHGALENLGDGTFRYTPATGYYGADTFVYEVCDLFGLCDTAAVGITVSCTNADGDGACADSDCDDLDPYVWPGTAEVCDGVDNDCDGATDGPGCIALVRLQEAATAPPGSDIVVPVALNPADGVVSLDLELTYDPAVLVLREVYTTAFFEGFFLTVNPNVPGNLRISLFALDPVFGSGEILWIVFRVTGGGGASTALHWTRQELNEGQIASAGRDGRIAVSDGATVLGMPKDAAGAPAPSPAQRQEVPVYAEPADGFAEVDLEVRFNELVIEAVAASTTAATSGFTLTPDLGTPGVAIVHLTGGSVPPGTGRVPIATITFDVVGEAGSVTPLDVRIGTVNGGALVAGLDDGLFTVCADADGDGRPGCGAAPDCDESDPDVGPGFPEARCNGIDDDCSALTRDVTDADGDGFDVCGPGDVIDPDGDPADCDDTRADVHPGAPEYCDGVDGNCSGVVDENPEAGLRSCGDGNVCTSDLCGAGAACAYEASGVCGIEGHVYYYRTVDRDGDGTADDPGELSGKPVAGVELDLLGWGAASDATTGADGRYRIADLMGSLTLTTLGRSGNPRADSGAEGSISSHDATQIARHSAGLAELTNLQRLAGDVSGNQRVSSYDASLVAQYAAQMIDHLPAATVRGSDWAFLRCDGGDPSHCPVWPPHPPDPQYQYAPIAAPESADFHAVLYGDVTGNWPNAAGFAAAGSRQAPGATAPGAGKFTPMTAPRSEAATLYVAEGPRRLRDGGWQVVFGLKRADGIQALDLVLGYRSGEISLGSVRAVGLAGNYQLLTNDDGRGSCRIALYGIAPMSGSGRFLEVTFRSDGQPTPSSAFEVDAEANEGLVPITW